MSYFDDLCDDSDPNMLDEWHHGDPQCVDPPPGSASGFEDDWAEDPNEPREWPEHDPEAQTKCHMGRV